MVWSPCTRQGALRISRATFAASSRQGCEESKTTLKETRKRTSRFADSCDGARAHRSLYHYRHSWIVKRGMPILVVIRDSQFCSCLSLCYAFWSCAPSRVPQCTVTIEILVPTVKTRNNLRPQRRDPLRNVDENCNTSDLSDRFPFKTDKQQQKRASTF